MLRDILNTHKEMMFNFMEVCDMDEYGFMVLFLKGALFTALIVWIF